MENKQELFSLFVQIMEDETRSENIEREWRGLIDQNK